MTLPPWASPACSLCCRRQCAPVRGQHLAVGGEVAPHCHRPSTRLHRLPSLRDSRRSLAVTVLSHAVMAGDLSGSRRFRTVSETVLNSSIRCQIRFRNCSETSNTCRTDNRPWLVYINNDCRAPGRAAPPSARRRTRTPSGARRARRCAVRRARPRRCCA